MSPTISFVCNGFPIISETFISNQIHHAIEIGYKVQIHADYFNEDQVKFLPAQLLQKEINNQVVLNYVTPNGKLYRFFKALNLARITGNKVALLKSLDPSKHFFRNFNLRNFYSISSFLKSERPDIVHAHFGPNGLKAVNARLAGLIDCPVITSFHGYDVYSTSNKRHHLKNYYKNLFKFGDIFLVNGEFLRNKLLEIGCPNKKIVVLPLGINHEVFKRKVEKQRDNVQEVKLVTVGRLISLKNQKLGIKILAWLVNRGWTVSYTLIGEGPERENLEKLSRELGVEENVIFMGSKNPVEVSEILQEQDIFLMTSDQDNMGRMETQGLVTAEAQACGLPVIVLGKGGTKDTLKPGETGFVIEDKSEDEVIEIIKYLIQPEVYKKFSAAAIKFAQEQFSIKKNNLVLEQIYQSLQKTHRGDILDPNIKSGIARI